MTSRGPVAALLLTLAFLIVAALNSGGYRYGASDQAFYIPAILDALHPELFPDDDALLAPQARYFFVDEAVAGAIRTIGGSIEGWFLAGYVLTLAILGLSLGALGRTVFRSPFAVTALLAAAALKHRITKTGVNTLEGYFHPRMLVYALGVAAVVIYLRGRPWLALLIVIASAFLHPTTAAFFVMLLGVASWVTEPRMRPALGAAAVAAAAGVVWLVVAGPWRTALTPMDPEWRALLATKDYLFPTAQWSPGTWFINLATAALAIGGLAARQRDGVGLPRERGLLAGAVVLFAFFVVSLPAIGAGVALAVQLQTSRVFWLLELLAWIPVIWWLVDRPVATRAHAKRWGLAAAGLLVAFAVGRAWFVAVVEHDRPVFQYSLPESDWTDAMRWIASHTPVDAGVLTDPGHAFRYGYPVRFAGRDVFIEEVKDTAMALYDRRAAERVATRLEALGDFQALTPDRVHALARRYPVAIVVTPFPLDMPERAAFGRFHIYAATPP